MIIVIMAVIMGVVILLIRAVAVVVLLLSVILVVFPVVVVPVVVLVVVLVKVVVTAVVVVVGARAPGKGQCLCPAPTRTPSTAFLLSSVSLTVLPPSAAVRLPSNLAFVAKTPFDLVKSVFAMVLNPPLCVVLDPGVIRPSNFEPTLAPTQKDHTTIITLSITTRRIVMATGGTN